MTTPDLPPPAQGAAFYCNKCGYFGPVGPSHVRGDNELCNYLAAQIGPHWTQDQPLAALAPYKEEAERRRGQVDRYEAEIERLFARIKELECDIEMNGSYQGCKSDLREAEAALAAEREACAKVCDFLRTKTLEAQRGNPSELENVMLRQVAELGHGECAAAIRARGTNDVSSSPSQTSFADPQS